MRRRAGKQRVTVVFGCPYGLLFERGIGCVMAGVITLLRKTEWTYQIVSHFALPPSHGRIYCLVQSDTLSRIPTSCCS